MDIPKQNRKLKSDLTGFYLPLLLLMTAGYCMTPLAAGVDIWAHAAVGRWIVEHQQIPRHTLFLWSDSIPWVWHSWLSQLIFYQLFAYVPEKMGAFLGMTLTACAAIFSLLMWWKVWIKRQLVLTGSDIPRPAMALIFLLAIFTAHQRFHPRPEIFSAIFLTLLLLMLLRGITSWSSLAALFVMFVMWANLHGGLAVGFVFLGISTLCNLLQDRSWKNSRWEFLAIAAVITAIFVNPYGWHYWAALKPVTSTTFSFIDEWKPFWISPWMDIPTIIAAFLCFTAALLAWLASERRRLAHLGWLVAAFALFLIARRNIWILAQVTLAVIACNPRLFITKSILTTWFQRFRRKKTPTLVSGKSQSFLRRATFGILIVGALQAQSSEFWQGQFVSPKAPVGAAHFLQTIPSNERIFNGYQISSYLEWKLMGKPPLYIDLLNAYKPEIMENYIKAIEGGGAAASFLKKWNITYIVLPQIEENPYIGRLFIWLSIQQHWEIIYNEADGVIWKYNPNAKPKALFQLQ